jgi:hypothetical protein
MSKSSTISLDVLNALPYQKGMLNASVKELENQVFNSFHSIVAPVEKNCGSYCCQRWQLVCETVISIQTRRVSWSQIRVIESGIVQMGLTKVESIVFSQSSCKKWIGLLEKSTARVSLPMSFYVVSVKDRIQESTNIMYPPYCYCCSLMRLRSLRNRSKAD